jgi:hypothetical protein
MVDEAKAKAEALIDALLPFAERGIPIVGLEPSCLLTLRDETLVMGFGEKAETVAAGAAVRGIPGARAEGRAASSLLSSPPPSPSCCTATATRRPSAR